MTTPGAEPAPTVDTMNHDDPEDQIAAQAEVFDEALISGEVPDSDHSLPEGPDALAAYMAARASLQLLERVWPRSEYRVSSSTESGRGDTPVDAAFGRFQIVRELGRGGFGVVFLAIDSALKRPVALKLPRAEALLTPEARLRFAREAKAAAALDHPNLVALYEAGEVNSVCYLASAYCDGPTLAAWLREQTEPVPPRLAARLAADLADAVRHAHERGVLHRDIKPSNILLQRAEGQAGAPESNGEPSPIEQEFMPRITDFGLARLMDRPGEEITASFAAMGSAPYMAPEQAEGRKVGPAADVYSLGAILYVLLCGRPPHRGKTELETLHEVVNNEPIAPRRRRRDVPRDLEAICLKCLEKNPERRYASARSLGEDLNRFLNREPIVARPPRPWEVLRRQARRHPAAVVVVALLALWVGTLVAARSWFERRLDANRESAQRLRDEVSDRALAARRARYVAGIRQAREHIQHQRTHLADEILGRNRPLPGESDLRGFPWYHLWHRSHGEVRTLTGHRRDVYDVEFSPSGDLLASAGKDGTVRIWDTSRWQPVLEIVASQREVNVATFSADGRTVATVDDDGVLKLWETATGLCQLKGPADTGDAVVVRFSPDGTSIVTGSRSNGHVVIRDRRNGSVRGEFRTGDRDLENFVFSPDGSILATAGSGAAKLWKWPAGDLVVALPNSAGAQALAFSQDGATLATAHESDNNPVRLWDARHGRLLREFRGHTGGVFAVAFSADDRTIYSSSDDETIRAWDAATGMQVGLYVGHSLRVWDLCLSHDGRTLASSGQDGTVKLWDLKSPQDRFKLPVTAPRMFGFSPDGRTLMVFELEPRCAVTRWDVRSGSLVERKPLNLTGSPRSCAFSHDGRLVAVWNEDGTATLTDLTTDHRESLPDPAVRKANLLEFSPDDRYLLFAYLEQPYPQLWDLARRRVIRVPWSTAIDCPWSPSQELMTQLEDGKLEWWNPTTGQMRITSRTLDARIIKVGFSPDGRFAASVKRWSRDVDLRSLETLELVKVFTTQFAPTRFIEFSSDGNTLALNGYDDHTVALWDVATGEELLTLEGFSGPTILLRFSPDGKALATLSRTGPAEQFEVRLWRGAGDQSEPAHSQPGGFAK